jgi:hypothetical protein
MPPRKSMPKRVMPLVEAASSKDALDFVRSLQAIKTASPKDFERRIADLVGDTKLSTLQSFARRLMMDFAKGPPYDEGGTKARPGPPAGGATPPGRRPSAGSGGDTPPSGDTKPIKRKRRSPRDRDGA